MPGTTQPDWLTAAAADAPRAFALQEGDDYWDYETFNTYVGFNADGLHRLGIGDGSRVGILLPNCIEYAVLVFALWRVGATTVLLNTRLTLDELRYQVAVAGCTAVIAEAGLPAEYFTSLGTTVHPFEPHRGITTFLNGRDHDFERWGGTTYTRLKIAAIVFTSGSSGTPKGAQLTFNNLFYAATASTLRLGNVPDDRWLLTLPLYHVGGLSILVRAVLCRAGVVIQNGFDPAAVWHALRNDGITLLSLVPTTLFRLLQSEHLPDKHYRGYWYVADDPPGVLNLPAASNPELRTQNSELGTNNLRLVLLGGAAATPELVEQAAARGFPIATTYGLTEAASQVCTALPDEARRKPGSVGKPLPFIRVRVVDGDGRDVPQGEYGEIVVYGPNVMWGYLGEARDIPLTQWGTPAYLPYADGFHTGDIGYLDADGDLWLVQRRSDLIVTGGENVYPAEVERVLREHPLVADVCVVGVPDAEWGQRVAAAIDLAPETTIDSVGTTYRSSVLASPVASNPSSAASAVSSVIADLETYARERLAGYKLPRLWRVVAVLPLTASGKVDRVAVRGLFS
jgi:o-succinylbenzoate---CoA ligase